MTRWLSASFWWLVNALQCHHAHTYRERRPWNGVAGVMCLVCHDCGHVAPVLTRTATDHIRAQRIGHPRVSRGRVQSSVSHLRRVK